MGSWDQRWEPPAKGAVTQARQRVGPEPLAELFSQVAGPVAGLEAEGAFLGPWRLMPAGGTEMDVPDTAANREAFGAGANDGPFPKVRLVTEEVRRCSGTRCGGGCTAMGMRAVWPGSSSRRRPGWPRPGESPHPGRLPGAVEAFEPIAARYPVFRITAAREAARR